MEVHRELDYGFHRVIFQDDLEVQFRLRGIPCFREKPNHVFYKQYTLASSLRSDFVCHEAVLVEPKAFSISELARP